MYNQRITRWMYRDHHPNRMARALGHLWATMASSGVIAASGMVTLEVTGRASGRTISLPVVIVVVDGKRYLVSMLGGNVQWVKNVRAAGGRAALRSGKREYVHLEEVPVSQRAPILRVYLRHAPGARPHFPVTKDAPLVDFEPIAGDFPVFRVISVGTEQTARN